MICAYCGVSFVVTPVTLWPTKNECAAHCATLPPCLLPLVTYHFLLSNDDAGGPSTCPVRQRKSCPGTIG
jgi:hypothetical protein